VWGGGQSLQVGSLGRCGFLNVKRERERQRRISLPGVPQFNGEGLVSFWGGCQEAFSKKRVAKVRREG